MSTENALLTILVEKINNDTLVLPTLPAIALKVRKAADDPTVNLNKMGEVIGQDPALSARIMKIANSAYLGRTVKVENLHQAVTRIGLRQIKNIATALAMEQLFVSKNPIVGEYLSKLWDRTVDVTANAMAVFQIYTKQADKNKNLNMDTLTLSALVHNIGVLPILSEAERHQDVFANPTFLNVAIQKLAGRLGSTILDSWGFNKEMAEITENWRSLKFQTEKVSYLDFVRVGAVLSGAISSHKDDVLNITQQKAILPDLKVLDSDDFKTSRDEVKTIFK
ncbi:HDOD domain-containing protein [Neptunicella marina]|uniref:HDOD domain-containing protein n=1 Tax=Neptunicella marina TaxID=2125989 RepID=A0A8J6IR61_9ALTE|nr:HDOD domain-containing protein [Neptunicella marina]MBC3764834.1 HDOD domain-containing protein [Neptunicella marina]